MLPSLSEDQCAATHSARQPFSHEKHGREKTAISRLRYPSERAQSLNSTKGDAERRLQSQSIYNVHRVKAQ